MVKQKGALIELDFPIIQTTELSIDAVSVSKDYHLYRPLRNTSSSGYCFASMNASNLSFLSFWDLDMLSNGLNCVSSSFVYRKTKACHVLQAVFPSGKDLTELNPPYDKV
uniref:Uncharacterized protein n=1 Tax=Salix viminalis TaxID=40686 RepID=A0A6N2LSA8_SALVM